MAQPPPRAVQQAQDPFDDWEQAYDTTSAYASRPTPSSNARLWEAPAFIPMTGNYNTGGASSSGSAYYSTLQQPPQPKMTILKRPSSGNASSRSQSPSTSSSAGPAKSLAQREQEYKDARARIFGDDSDNSGNRNTAKASSPPPSRPGSATSLSSSRHQQQQVRATRAPQGPSTDESQGFNARRRAKAPVASPS